jgi:hypothetical protein
VDKQSKQCGSCQTTKPLAAFYQIKSSDEFNIRWEKLCKDCKRTRRKNKPQQAPSPPTVPFDGHSSSNRIRDDGEIIYKEYVYPNGETLQLTKEEFDRVVDLFRMLDKQDRKINGPPK